MVNHNRIAIDVKIIADEETRLQPVHRVVVAKRTSSSDGDDKYRRDGTSSFNPEEWLLRMTIIIIIMVIPEQIDFFSFSAVVHCIQASQNDDGWRMFLW